MASKAADSMSEPRKSVEDLKERGYGHLISITTEMKEEIRAIRLVQIQHKFDTNRRNMQRSMHLRFPANNKPCDVPLSGTERPLCVSNGFCPDSDDKDIANIHEVTFAKTTKLPKFPGIPKSKTWVFLKRNQRMAEDQSVVGRRRIYYDESGNEALICSDSEDDIPGVEEEKHNFSIGEDQIMLKAYSRKDSQNHKDADIADVVSHAIGASPVEIQERYEELKLKSNVPQESSSERNKFLKKSLSGVSDSLDNLFCRRCLVFDCRLHGCSQSLIYPSDKQISISEPENRKPCSDQCYLLGGQTSEAVIGRNLDIAPGEGCSAEYLSDSAVPLAQHESLAKRKFNSENNREVEVSKVLRNSVHKKSLTIQAVEPTTIVGETVSETISSAKIKKLSTKTHQCMDTQVTCKHPLEEHTASVLTDASSQRTFSPQGSLTFRDEVREMNKRLKLMQPTVSLGKGEKGFSSNCEWKPLEKDLYRKGLEIFGRNSCLIARNLLSGLKTCSEVSSYMRDSRALMTHEMDIVCSEDNAGADIDNMEQEGLVKSRLVRKKGRSRRFKYSTKSNGLPSSLKRNGDGDQPYKQYTPCDCKFMCGKDCSCLKRGTCCEKYCGCSKGCKNKFRGCHCAKSQCRSRQCPCFAADRECDPDVCRNCWVSCGDGRFGEPPKKGDAQAHCGNMRLLLRQQQRIILGKSDVAGWGAFIKNTVNKHDYLGEYTGELISHREADKRGKIYDRANSSFLFDLNDQYVLDACRQGDKLKFANHSSNPNCYCKIMLVGGDHRVGIFAKERIEAGEELFYDYRYGDDQAPAWARGPVEPKKDDPVPSKSRARKHQSR